MAKIKHHTNSKLPHLFKARAITFNKHIFYTESNPPEWLIRHELKHAEQYAKHGIVVFLLTYIIDYLKGRLKGLSDYEAYLNIPFEIEAREAEQRGGDYDKTKELQRY